MYAMSKPVILVPIPVQDAEQRRYQLGKHYVNSLIACGAIPVLAPVLLDDASLRGLYERADGVLLTGGDDVDPALFGEAPHAKTSGIDADRDRAESALTRWAVADDKPMLGICRGIQVMNVALGGSLIQDIPSQAPSDLVHPGHWVGARRDEVHHTVCIEANTRLAGIVGFGDVGVNSFHHQSIKRAAQPFRITARAPDGIVEAVEIAGHAFCVGVQWHPEEMAANRADMMRLFQALTDASA